MFDSSVMQATKIGNDRYEKGSDHEFSRVNDFSDLQNSQVNPDPKSAPRKIQPLHENINRSYSIEQELQAMA